MVMNIRILPLPTLALSGVLFLYANVASAAAINTNTSLTPSAGTTIIRSQLRFTHATDDPSKMDRKKDMFTWSNTLVYGVTGNFTLGFTLPLMDVDVDSDMGQLANKREIGDVPIFGKYRFWQRDAIGSTDRLAALLGLEVPTGSDLSSHSWDPLFGLVYTHQGLTKFGYQWEVNADLVYQWNTNGEGINGGDVLRYDLAVSHQIWPWPARTSNTILMGVLELNGALSGRDTRGGDALDATGGHRLYISLGLELVTQRFILELGIKIPVVQDLNDRQLREDYSASIGFRIQF